jgi:cysteine desulfurase
MRMTDVTDPIYLDHSATTPLDPGVLAAMLPYLEKHFGNPSSSHAYGQAAKVGVDVARGQVASLLGCAADEVVFTSGGSESNNSALIGVALANRDRGVHIVTTEIEHPSVAATRRYLEERFGLSVSYVPVDGLGQVDPEAVERALTPRTILVSVMHAKNETGVLRPIKGRPDTLPTSRTFRRRCAYVASTIPSSGRGCRSTAGCVVMAAWT